METKDIIMIVVLISTWLMFVLRLFWDGRANRFKETIVFLEKKDKLMRDVFRSLKNGTISKEDAESGWCEFMAQLELVSFLIAKKVFEDEAVYQYWWRYFDEVLRIEEVNTWVAIERQADSHMYANYLWLAKKWSKRIDAERG